MNPLATLKQYWGHTSFRPLQAEIIQAVLQGQDVLALLPTGGGKSICFQIPALLRPGLCLVVSPLIALMKDQVDQLQQRGIAAAALFSGMPSHAIDVALDNCIYGKVKFLYVSPERLQTELLQERVKKMTVNLLAVDEAHCISQWGYDFRPAYLEIAAFRAFLPNVNTIALTATATAAVKQDIQNKLQLRQPAFFQKSFARSNLAYVVRKTTDKDRQLLKIIRGVPGTAIVYVKTRNKTQTIAQLLQRHQVSAVAYHAGLTAAERTQRQAAWLQGKVSVMVATNAFGMGIDKPDVRLVIHLDLPSTLEAYYQEAGRAGRDEQHAYAVVLYEDHDLQRLQESTQAAHPTIAQLKSVYQHLANYYQIAVGSHAMATYDFDIEDFAHTYGLRPAVAYQALKTLESEGLIQLNETFFQPAQLYIPIAPKALYAFQVANAYHDPLLKLLLRLYGGVLFSAPCPISESRIARGLRSTPQQVKAQLQTLHRLEVVQYHPQKDHPQLTFTTARHPVATLPLDTQMLQQRATIAKEKAEAVCHYVTHQHRCRTQLLLEYFGEVSYQKCGNCDLCLQKQKGNGPAAVSSKHRHTILQHLQTGPHDLNTLVDKMDWAADEEILTTVRQMLEEGSLAYDGFGKLALKKV